MSEFDQLLEAGDDAWESGDFEQALTCAERALEFDPSSIAALDLKATTLAELGDFEAADEAYSELMRREPKNPAFALAAADVLIRQPGDDRDRIVDGLVLLKKLDRLAKQDDSLKVEVELLRGVGHNALGDCAQALSSLEAVLKVAPDDGEALVEKGVALFELCRFDETRRVFEEVSRRFPSDPWAFHYLGLLEERKGRDPSSFFEKARVLAPEDYPAPVKLSGAEFDRALHQAIDQLPAHARPHLDNAVIDVAPIPSDEDLKEGGVSPIVLGLFRGTPIDERSPVDAAAQQTIHITLYQKNLERFARTREELIEEIGVTLLHEVGHLLGLDEDELYQRGLD